MNKEDLIADQIVIPDECGDSLWDAVLDQQLHSDDIKNSSGVPTASPKRNNEVQVCDPAYAN